MTAAPRLTAQTQGDHLAEVTVIIPTKDRPRLACNAAAMALAQGTPSPHVLVVDNGSLPKHAESLRRGLEPRSELITVPEQIGVSAARNIGLRAATTRWVAFLDDDDYWTPRKLATQMRALTADPQRRWVMSGTVAVTEGGRFVGLSLPATIADDYYRDILTHPPPVAMSDLVVDRELAIAVGGFRTDLAHWEDWDFTIRYAEHAAAPVTVREMLSVYWVRKAAATSDFPALMASLDEFIDMHAPRRAEANVEFDRNELDYYLAYRATRFPHTSSFATSLYRGLLRRTRRPQFAAYVVLSRFTPRVFGRLTEWDKLRRLARNERREVSRIVEEARSSPYASVRGERDSVSRGHLEP